MAKSTRAEGTGGTRERILDLLCAADLTTSALARELGISANGTRGHLELLEREGLVSRSVVRRGVGKPAYAYRLTAEGSLRISRAYLALLSALLSELTEHWTAAEQERLLRQVGRRLVRDRAPLNGPLEARVDAAVELLRSLGGRSRATKESDGMRIDGECCPLRAVVREHDQTCKAVESMLAAYIGHPVREACVRQELPACRFVVSAAR